MTDLVKYEDLSSEQLLALTGQSQGQSTFQDFPRVTINKLGEDDQGHTIPIGAYQVSYNGRTLFGKPVYFRPFLNAYQYAVYDAETNTYPNKSIIIKNFGEEAVDELGGVACGKLSAKKREGLTGEMLAKQKTIKCYRIMYGLLTCHKAVDVDGGEHAVENLPVKFRLSGDNFMPIQEILDALSKQKKSMLNYDVELLTKRKKNGTNVYYKMVPALKDTFKPISKDDWEVLQQFQSAIDTENKAVIEKHHKARQVKQDIETDAKAVLELDADLNDNIEDIGR